MPYQPADLVPVGYSADLPLFLFVNNDIPANTVQEFIDHAKKNEGRLNYACSGTGFKAHLTRVFFAVKTGLKNGLHSVQGQCAFSWRT